MFKSKSGKILHLRQANRADIEQIHAIMVKEKFEIGFHNLLMFYEHSPETWYVIAEEDGKIIAWDSSNRLPLGDRDEYYAFSLYLDTEFRGEGVSQKFRPVMPAHSLGNASKYTLVRYKIEKVYDKLLPFFGNCSRVSAIKPDVSPTFQLINITNDNFKLTAGYDRKILGFDRSKFMKEWILPEKYPCKSYGVMAASATDNHVIGYGVIREASGFFMICLYADSDIVAEWLFYTLLTKLQTTDQAFVFFPAKSRSVMQIVIRLKWILMGEALTRLHYKPLPNPLPWDFDKCYGVHEYFPM